MDSNAKPMYEAVCAECGKEFKIPFQPKEDRPVYCLECFRKIRHQRSGGFSNPRQMFSAVCSECGKVCQVPFRPKKDRLIYCRECYAVKKGR